MYINDACVLDLTFHKESLVCVRILYCTYTFTGFFFKAGETPSTKDERKRRRRRRRRRREGPIIYARYNTWIILYFFVQQRISYRQPGWVYIFRIKEVRGSYPDGIKDPVQDFSI